MRMSVLLRVLRFVEAKRYLRSADEDRPFDEIRLLHHQVDRFLLRLRQRPGLEDRTAPADEVEEVRLVDVTLQKRPVGRILVDVTFFDVDLLLLQKTSGVAAGRSRRLPVEDRFRHVSILGCFETLRPRSPHPPRGARRSL
jgi:hypothetical protein